MKKNFVLLFSVALCLFSCSKPEPAAKTAEQIEEEVSLAIATFATSHDFDTVCLNDVIDLNGVNNNINYPKLMFEQIGNTNIYTVYFSLPMGGTQLETVVENFRPTCYKKDWSSGVVCSSTNMPIRLLGTLLAFKAVKTDNADVAFEGMYTTNRSDNRQEYSFIKSNDGYPINKMSYVEYIDEYWWNVNCFVDAKQINLRVTHKDDGLYDIELWYGVEESQQGGLKQYAYITVHDAKLLKIDENSSLKKFVDDMNEKGRPLFTHYLSY